MMGPEVAVPREFLQVDPRTLHLPPNRQDGTDPYKLARQKALHGDSIDGMPPVPVRRCKGGRLMALDGVTRATRAAELLPGVPIPAEVAEERPDQDVSSYPTVGDRLP
jgi:hypothetical protein